MTLQKDRYGKKYMMECDELGKRDILLNSLLLVLITKHNITDRRSSENAKHMKVRNKNEQTGLIRNNN